MSVKFRSFFYGVSFVFLISLGVSSPALAEDNTGVKLTQIDERLTKMEQNQKLILEKFEEVFKELQVIKVRAHRG